MGEARGVGDRWLAGEGVPGVRFGWREGVRVLAGPYAGERGTVLLLARVRPRVEYVVEVAGREVRVADEALEAG